MAVTVTVMVLVTVMVTVTLLCMMNCLATVECFCACCFLCVFVQCLYVKVVDDCMLQRHNIYKNMPSATYIPPLYFKIITVAIILFTLSIGIAVPSGELLPQ